ncbi:MAG: protein kinase [Candidatus Riflebacteria bacterium]|nr:protein kinase [Candidatus Riflebacteria bacterium]
MNSVELKIVQGELQGKSFTITRPLCILVGRARDAMIRITDDPFVSRHHLLIEVSPPFVFLSDLGSKNGFTLNEIHYGSAGSIKSMFLSDGDNIGIGKSLFNITILSEDVKGRQKQNKSSGKTVFPFSGVPSSAMEVLKPGFVFGKYRIIHEIGKGWTGSSYQAVDTESGSMVSLKTIVPNVVFSKDNAEMFLKEMNSLKDLEHPSICRLIDFGRDGNIFYCVSEYVNGMDLSKMLALHGGRMRIEEAFQIMLDILDGLSYSWKKTGLLHRNLKPGNILTYTKEKKIRARISDFGIFPSMEKSGLSQMILSGNYAEAPKYWPRERITYFDKIDASSEVFSAAAIFSQILTGYPLRDNLPVVRLTADKNSRIPGLAAHLECIVSNNVIPLRDRKKDVPQWAAEIIDHALSEPVIHREKQDLTAIFSQERFPDIISFRSALQKSAEAAGISYIREEPDVQSEVNAPQMPEIKKDLDSVDNQVHQPQQLQPVQNVSQALSPSQPQKLQDVTVIRGNILKAENLNDAPADLHRDEISEQKSSSSAENDKKTVLYRLPSSDSPADEKIEAALLVIDLAGSTQLVNSRGTYFFTSVVNSFNNLFKTHETAKGLIFLKCTGDGFFAIYRQAEDALQISRALLKDAEKNDVFVRIALNWGGITVASDGDFLGREVHRLFRIEGLKKSDRVSDCAPEFKNDTDFPVANRILGTKAYFEKTSASYKSIGLFTLKGFDEPWEIFICQP